MKQLLDTALSLEGLTRHASTHAAGVVIGNRPLIDLVPLYRDPKSGEVVTQFDMNMVERIGLVKFDFLGLRTLTVIADAEKLVRANGHPDFSVGSLPMDDKKTYELFAKGDTEGVFQMESPGMTELATKLKPKVFREIIPLIALYRTGPIESGALQEYVDRKLGMARVEYFLPQFEEVTKETLGVIVYQDQVLQIANRVSGYSLGEADFLRRAMGKKKPEEMEKQRERFVSGAVAKGVDAKRAQALFEMIEKFAGYAFPKAHSTAYALITYQTAYLKANHPREYLAALLTIESGNTEKLGKYIGHARDRGIPVLAPELNSSERDFTVVPEGIRFGFAGVKNVGEAAIEAILEQRTAGGAFTGLYDFAQRIDSRRVNKRVLESLIKCGAFDFTKATRASLWAALPIALERAQRLQRDREAGQVSLFGVDEPSADPALPELKEWESAELLGYEKEMLGFYVTGHPLREHARPLELFTSFRLDRVPDDPARRREVWIGGLLGGLRVQNTRKGDLMARALLEDLGGSLDVVFFPKTYAKFSALLQADAPVLVKGNVGGEPERPELHADEILPLADAWNQRTSRIVVQVAADEIGGERLRELRRALDLVPGSVPVGFELALPGGAVAVFDLPRHRVRVSEKLVSELDGIFARGADPVPGRVRRALLIAFAVLAASPARALEPASVAVTGVVSAAEVGQAAPRDAAYRAGLVAAVLESAKSLLGPDKFALEIERLRETLKPTAQRFVLTYRIDGPLEKRHSPLDPAVEEYALPLTARVDIGQLRAFLVHEGFLHEAGDRPSLALRVVPVGQLASKPPAGALAHLEQTVRKTLVEKQFVLVEPALRPGVGADPTSALELARTTGADVALELEVDWRPSPGAASVPGGVAEVRARAQRSEDGSELASSRFEGAGYHADRDAAIARALEAVEPQVGENLALQLERNWQAVAATDRPVELGLDSVSSLQQVLAVRQVLLKQLGARTAEVRELRPHGATLQVVSPLGPGALQEKLASARFDGFALTPEDAGAGRARLRVDAQPAAPETLAPGPPQN